MYVAMFKYSIVILNVLDLVSVKAVIIQVV